MILNLSPPTAVARKKVDKPTKEATRGVGRPAVQLLGRGDLPQPAVEHDRDPIGDGHGLGLIVGDVNDGRPGGSVKPPEFLEHSFPEVHIQVGQGFVHEDDARLLGKTPGQGDPLLLPSGKLVGAAGGHTLQADGGQGPGGGGGGHSPPALGPVDFHHPQGVADVGFHSHMGPQGVGLKNNPDIAALRRACFGRGPK